MFPVPDRTYCTELLDRPEDCGGHGELAGSLADIRVVNRYLGGVSASLRHLDELAPYAGGLPTGEKLSVLDVATGSADIPVEMVGWAGRRGISVKITAVDISRSIVGHAKLLAAGYPEISFAVADGLRLPFSDGSFDIVHCSLALHHFREDDATLLISELARTARRGFIVCDLRRSWVAYGLIYILTRFLTDNRMTKNDGPVSVLRAFTKRELAALASGAGLSGFRVVSHPFWRMALVGRRV